MWKGKWDYSKMQLVAGAIPAHFASYSSLIRIFQTPNDSMYQWLITGKLQVHFIEPSMNNFKPTINLVCDVTQTHKC